MSALEENMLEQFVESNMPMPEREFQFHRTRKWRFDFAWPQLKLALEVEGWGRHSTFKGMTDDCEKYANAIIEGWRVLRATSAQVTNGDALEWVFTIMQQGAKDARG